MFPLGWGGVGGVRGGVQKEKCHEPRVWVILVNQAQTKGQIKKLQVMAWAC